MSTRTRRTRSPWTSRSSESTPRAGLDPQRWLAGQPVIVNVLRHAPDAVAAHFRLGAVGIEHLHPGVGDLGGEDEDQAVAADAEVAVGDSAGEFRGVGGAGWAKQST